jgi:membrane-bound lytic murein transglycosylase D
VAPANTYTVHRVRRGETLSGIAARYGTSVNSIMEINRLRSAHRIWPGQQLQVPDRGVTAAYAERLAPGEEVTYTVRRGDSLWSLAKRYGTNVDRIRRDNGLQSNLLKPGQTLKLRSATGSRAGGGTYVVQRGDTLGAIARARGVSLSNLLAANGLSRRSTIYPGQQLAIPD